MSCLAAPSGGDGVEADALVDERVGGVFLRVLLHAVQPLVWASTLSTM